ncbi:hypothetical protein IFM89_028373 [Coptis chinensis]|uniref:Uncharacterized protein n=1 Tax=Coptis chinensis TaxID=261450 RepID=A0A835MDT0_9MAGN|nr:hypothetical protein IFM89_028373 [Coptis chinensis]
MAETISLKRLREDDDEEEVESKRHNSSSSSSSYNQILSLLEEDEEEPTQDLSSLITTLQQEISSDHVTEQNLETTTPTSLSVSPSFKDSSSEDEGEKERVIRHLLEASDDELGIPNSDDVRVNEEEEECYGVDGGSGSFEFALCDGLWEFEDETANYYTLLQSELFL